MSLLSPRRTHKTVAVAAAATLVVAASLVVQASPAQAAAMTITSSSPLKVAADLANRVVTITGTNFSEDEIVDITLGSDVNCANLTSYVVTNTTSISVKTPANGCDPSPNQALGEDITIDAVAPAVDVVKTGGAAAGIIFVAPPAIAILDPGVLQSVKTENSSALPVADQVMDLHSGGSQLIRIKAGLSYQFSGAVANGLSGSYGGKALTTVAFYAADGTTSQALTAAGSNGNFWVARTGTALDATTNALTITQNGVSRTFTAAETGLTLTAPPVISSLDVSSGKVGASTTVKLTGANFGTVAAELGVTICGEVAQVLTTPAVTATSISVVTPGPGTTPATTVANLVAAFGTDGLAVGDAGVCRIEVTRTPAGGGGPYVSPISAASFFTFLDR